MSESDKVRLELFESRYKEVSETQEFKYNPEDWYALQQMMNEDDRKRRPISWIFLGSSLLILVLVLTFVYMRSDFDSLNGSEISNDIADSPTTDLKTSDNIFDTNSIEVNGEMPEKKSTQIINSADKNNLVSSPEFTLSDNINSSQTLTRTEQTNLDVQTQSELTINDVSQNNRLISKDSKSPIKGKTESTQNSDLRHLENINPLPLLISELDKNNQQAISFENPIEVQSSKSSPRFVFNINGGVELSQTPLGELSDADYNLGFKFGYIISNKMAPTAGVSYMRECYIAATPDYTVPLGFWQGNPPDQVQAVCDMVDFTIGASYHFNGVLDNGLIAHLNLSSNNMIREVYEYQFINNEQDNWVDDFNFANSTLLSTLELGASYKFFAGKRYYIDGGPYMKIPINGIGNGDVLLRSYGFRVGISFID